MAGPTQRLPSDERKKQLLRCAAKVFARTNYRKARVADIAAEAGISEAAVYRHFPSKKAIFLEALHDIARSVALRLQEEASREHDALAAMRAMASTFYNLTAERPDEVRVQVQAISEIHDPEIAESLQRDHLEWMSFLSGLIEKGIEQGKIRKDVDVATLVMVLDAVAMFIQTLSMLSLRDHFTEETALNMTEHVIDSVRA